MASPVRYPQGVSTGAKGTALFNFPAQDPSKVFSYFNDFTNYTAGDWTVTVIGVTPTATLVANEPWGALVFTNTAVDNDGIQLQLVPSVISPVAGKKMWFKTRLKVSDATQSDVLVGLAVADTTLLGAIDGAGVTDGIFFSKEDGDTQWDVQVQKDATTGQKRSANVATVTTGYVTLGFEYDGAGHTKFFVDDVHKTTLDSSSTYFPDTVLTPSIALLNGEAVAKTLTIDYVFAAIER